MSIAIQEGHLPTSPRRLPMGTYPMGHRELALPHPHHQDFQVRGRTPATCPTGHMMPALHLPRHQDPRGQGKTMPLEMALHHLPGAQPLRPQPLPHPAKPHLPLALPWE